MTPDDPASAYRTDPRFASWGRVDRWPHRVAHPVFRDELPRLETALSPEFKGLAVGNRRSYGDSVLNPDGGIIDMTGLGRFLSFDRQSGLVRAEAGMTLSACLGTLVPAGFFLPTTPGTRFATLGGALANDVHGKNHHSAGNFGNSVTRFGLRRSDSGYSEVAPGDPLFAATIGGLGLTGIIEWVEFRAVPIPSSTLDAVDIPFSNVDAYFELSSRMKEKYEHTMAWIDCLSGGASLGRGILSCANWSPQGKLTAHREEPRKSMPIDAPGFALNGLTVKAFNTFYNGIKTMGSGRYRTHFEPFMYPLDAIANWNKLYGKAGFYQYQCVIPPETAKAAVRDMLTLIAKSGQGSFLAVLKDFGPIPSLGMLSFPMPGSTLALDFPNKGARTTALMAELDRIVLAAKGRLYPAKDGRITLAMFEAGYPGWRDFAALKDPLLTSSLWRRLTR